MEVILITAADVRQSDIKQMALPKIDFKDHEHSGIVFNSDKESYLDVIESADNRNYYEEKELKSLEERFGSLNFFVIIFNKFVDLKQFLQIFPDDVKILIDNDFDKIMTRDEVLKFESYDEFTA